jgi:beta-xylosidase
MMDGEISTARVGEPLTLSITVDDPEEIPLGATRIIWAKHQGPGPVTFSAEETEVVEQSDTFYHTAVAVFSEPGDYVLRVQAVDWDRGNAFGFHCCWTNRYVRVAVTE